VLDLDAHANFRLGLDSGPANFSVSLGCVGIPEGQTGSINGDRESDSRSRAVEPIIHVSAKSLGRNHGILAVRRSHGNHPQHRVQRDPYGPEKTRLWDRASAPDSPNDEVILEPILEEAKIPKDPRPSPMAKFDFEQFYQESVARPCAFHSNGTHRRIDLGVVEGSQHFPMRVPMDLARG
jgi:hypothetical protein